MKKTILLMFIFILLCVNVIASVTFYGDTILYLDNGDIEVTFVDSGITMD